MRTICRIGLWIIALTLFTGGTGLAARDTREFILGDARRLEAAVDDIVTNRMQKSHVPGAVVTIVRGNEIVFSKGYGFANLEERRPVDAERTLFRVASVSLAASHKSCPVPSRP